jgi:hypothetical protein
MALVSVYGTDPLWGSLGFQDVDKLQTYGPTARYMIKPLAP